MKKIFKANHTIKSRKFCTSKLKGKHRVFQKKRNSEFKTPSTVKKSLSQEVRQKSDISEHRSKGLGASLLCLQQGCWVTVRPVRGHPTPKMNITFFLSQIRCWIFFYSTTFLKNAVFSEKTAENCFGGASDNFLRKKDVLLQK